MGDEAKNAEVSPETPILLAETDLFPDRPPRLIVAINRLDVPPHRWKAKAREPGESVPAAEEGDSILCADGASFVSEILNFIVDDGLDASRIDDAWATDAGKDQLVDREAIPNVEECCWAAITSELFMLNAYGAPDGAKFSEEFAHVRADGDNERVHCQLAYIYQRLQLDYVPKADWQPDAKYLEEAARTPNADPAYSLVTACQQLTTYFLIARGFNVEADMAGTGLMASVASGKGKVFSEERGGEWIFAKGGRGILLASDAVDRGAGPGSIYIFDPNEGEASDVQAFGSHIWPILRVRPADAAADVRFQNFEGCYASQDRLPPLRPDLPRAAQKEAYIAFNGGTRFEGEWLPSAYDPGHVCALGIPAKATRLGEALDHMRRARPVGLCRLVLTDRRTNAVLFASHLVRMWDDAGENYAPSRLLMSLRNTPYYASIQARWFLFSPVGSLAEVMWTEGNRGWSASKLIAEALALNKARGVGREGYLNHADLHCMQILTHDEQGIAKVEFRYHDSKAQAPTTQLTIAFGQPSEASGGGLAGQPGIHWEGQYLHPTIKATKARVEVPEFLVSETVGYDPKAKEST